MNRSENLYQAETIKGTARFVRDFEVICKKYGFVVNNSDSMDMKKTFRAHGGVVPDDFDLHMMQVCKPTKADKSLTANPERAILMPKFVMVFSKDGKTQIRYMSYSATDIAEMVPGDPKFPESLAETFAKIKSMIDEAK
jgi:uncharacterized protein (DUF302 family)